MSDETHISVEEIVDESIVTDEWPWENSDPAKYFFVGFPLGDRFAIPASVIAENRAAYYAEKDHPDDKDKRLDKFYEEREYTLNDDLELLDWIKNQMDWEDVEPFAIRLEARGATLHGLCGRQKRPQERDDDPLSEQWSDAEITVEEIDLE